MLQAAWNKAIIAVGFLIAFPLLGQWFSVEMQGYKAHFVLKKREMRIYDVEEYTFV